MPSLTPGHRAEETSVAAFQDGMMSGALALVPSGACVYLAMRNYPGFARATNWQSRTALVVMPALFAFAFTSESKLQHRMQEMAAEADHARATTEWAERQRVRRIERSREQGGSSAVAGGGGQGGVGGTPALVDTMSKEDAERQLTDLYRKGVESSGVRIVPGDTLGVHHRLSNFLMENPFRTLAAVGVPAVLYIFKGRSEKSHLQLQMKLMHTRVFGQFTVITMLLTLMGFKSYMDSNGKFITEYEAQRKVEEMHSMRERLMERLEQDRAKMAERDRVLRRAHDKDLKRLGHSGKKENLARYGVLEDDLTEEEEEETMTKEEAQEIVSDAGEAKMAKSSAGKKRSETTSMDESKISPIAAEETEIVVAATSPLCEDGQKSGAWASSH